MGGHAWLYFVPYREDFEEALQELRRQEFTAGRYSPVQRYLMTSITSDSPSLGPEHDSLEEAIYTAGSEGTRSILDMFHISRRPKHGAVTALPSDKSLELFGTEHPTREAVATNSDLWNSIPRGQGFYILIYDRESPAEICFAGYSYD